MSTTRLNVDRTTLGGLDRLTRRLSYHTKRQEVLAGNLANLDTPGYRAKDVSFSETLTAATTAGGRLDRSMSFETRSTIADDEAPDLDGNTVSLEGQVSKMTTNMVQYRSLAELLSRRIGMLRYAATDGEG